MSCNAKGRNASRISLFGSPLACRTKSSRSPSSPVPGVRLQSGCPLDLRDCLADDGGRLAAAEEHQQCRLGVTPGEVAQELAERVPDRLCSLPDLAFGDEDVAVADTDEDVGLAGGVEHLAQRHPLRTAHSRRQGAGPGFLLIQVRGHRGSTLQRVARVPQYFQSLLVLLVGQHWLVLERPACGRPPGYIDLPPCQPLKP